MTAVRWPRALPVLDLLQRLVTPARAVSVSLKSRERRACRARRSRRPAYPAGHRSESSAVVWSSVMGMLLGLRCPVVYSNPSSEGARAGRATPGLGVSPPGWEALPLMRRTSLAIRPRLASRAGSSPACTLDLRLGRHDHAEGGESQPGPRRPRVDVGPTRWPKTRVHAWPTCALGGRAAKTGYQRTSDFGEGGARRRLGTAAAPGTTCWLSIWCRGRCATQPLRSSRRGRSTDPYQRKPRTFSKAPGRSGADRPRGPALRTLPGQARRLRT